MKNFDLSSKRLPFITHFLHAGRYFLLWSFSSSLNVFFLLLLSFFSIKTALAAEINKPSISHGVDEYGAYIEFSIRVKSQTGGKAAGNIQRITSGSLKYGNQEIATFSGANADWDNFQASVNIKNGYARAKGRTESLTGMLAAGSSVVVRDGTEGENTTLVLRWYVKEDLLNTSLKFSVNEYATGYYVSLFGSDDGALSDQGNISWSGSASVSFSIPDPEFSFTPSKNEGQMAVNYAYKAPNNVIGTADYTIMHWMNNNTADKVTDNSNQNASGTLNVAMANTRKVHSFNTRVLGKNNYLAYSRVTSVNVPAYVWPTSLKATYDSKNTVNIEWDANTSDLGTGYIDNDNFEVQRSTDKDFASNVVNVSTYAYSATQKTYAVSDNLSDVKGGNILYYRVRRTKTANDWNWKGSQTTSLTLQMNSTQKADTVVLREGNEGPAAVITWEPFRGVWTSGTKFSLKKLNKTTGTLAATIDLTEDQARSGKYVDENLMYCNEFTYALVVNLGNGFDSPPETKVPGSVLAVNIGTVDGLTASKGYFPDRTELQWHSQGIFDNYIIKRRIYGSSDNFIQIANIPGSSTSDLQTDDPKGTPGIYYEYMVLGSVKCNNEVRYSRDTLYAIGFRAPTGNIYGRITYENGQAVKDVAVQLESQDGTKLGQSVYLNGHGDSYLLIDSLRTPFKDSAFTVEAWVKPDDIAPKNQVIFSRDGQYELGFDTDGKLYFSYGGSQKVSGDYFNKNQSFVHITAIRHKDTLSILLNDSLLISQAASSSPAALTDNAVYIGANKAGHNFKGYIDEMRVWNAAVTPEYAMRYYSSLLTGGEDNLVAYWRFDETIVDQFYDISHRGDNYNQNDGIMDPQQVKHSEITPTFDQLALKAYTDSTGNYMISGVPYTGVNGTIYKIIPLWGTHQFDPVSVNRLVSANSSSFAVDFKDKSSFPVSGYVYYWNTTVPVSGAQFKIDGQYAQRNNGDIIETDASGKFEISVPVGIHEVKVVKSNHIFVNEGKITDRFGENLNYQGPISERKLHDSTTVRFIGRVSGGAIQEAYPLGHSLSENNLGRNLSVRLRLPVTGKYQLNESSADSTVSVFHLLPSNQSDSSKIHRTRVDYKSDTIVVHPDSLTGEFAVDLIPETFLVNDVTVTGWGDLLEGKPVTLDLSNKFAKEYSVNSFQDSVQNNKGGWDYTNYADTVAFNDSYQFIKREIPLVRIVQVDNGGKTLSYFGDTAYKYQSFTGSIKNIAVIDNNKPGKDKYLFAHPVFSQNKVYHFAINAYESYPFYEEVKADGTKVIAQENGKAIVDEVPTQDGFVTISNSIRNGPASPDTLSLDEKGTAKYDFSAGDPELTQGLKDFAASVRFGQATYVNWEWSPGVDQMQVFVAGGKLTGTDFVTAGPDKVLEILRDPPGSRSYSYLEKGSTIASSNTYTGSFDQVGDETLVQKLGAELVTFTGIGVGTINSAVTSTGIGFGIHHEEHYIGTNTKAESTTLTTRFQTSDDPAFVGPPADLYVGYSTNITYGQSNNITLIPRSEKKPSDSVIYDAGSSHLIVRRSGINIGQTFGTLFAYPQQHLIMVLIPNLIKIRNTILLPKGTPAAQAQLAANNSKAAVYVSKLDASDPNFGKSNNDTTAFGSEAKTLPFDDGKSYAIYFPVTSLYRTDTIMTLNQYVQKWEQRIADNEKDKLNASLMQNYSFHAGNPIEYSEQTTHDTITNNSFNIIISGSITNSTDVKIMGNGFSFTFNESVGTSQGGEFSETQSSSRTQGFILASDGTDDYVSVDVKKDDNKSFVFRTMGGVTGCPYEGALVTQYYQPGTPLGEPTQRAEVPVLSVDKPVVNDIPSSRKASYTLRLRNESEAQLPASFVLTYADVDSIKGAAIAIDGSLIGGNGRVIAVPYGETVTKVLTLAKGPDAMDYENIPIILHSSCQYDPIGYQELIADTVFISAHFIPSCSDINIKQPVENWILNTVSPVNEQGKRYLPVTLDQFDITNNLFDHIELQYKPAAASQWITLVKYYADSARLNDADGEKRFITNAQGINYDLVMDDASFSDQQYDIRAESVCMLGPGDFITTSSNVISGLKDTYNPRLFGSPQPPNGVLGIEDDIRLNFNESIADGLLTPANFHVTGIRNGAIGDHSVAVLLDGKDDYLATEFEKNLTGKSISVEMWVLADGPANGTLFSQGNRNKSMELSLTSDNHLQVIVGQQSVESDKPLDYKKGEWAHVALVYNAATDKVSAFYNFVEVIHEVTVGDYDGVGHFEFGRSISGQGNFFSGKMHEARVWTDILSATRLQENSLKKLSGSENGLLAYYPMDEGKGKVIFDHAHGSNAAFIGDWSTPAGKSINLGNNGYVKINTSTTPITKDMDYTLELWFKGTPGQTDATLISNGKGDGTDPDHPADLFSLGFENGLLTYQNNSFKVQAEGDYLDNNWHHVAVDVNRNSGTSQLFVDGVLKKYFDAENLGGLASAYMYLGVRAWYDKDNAVTPHLDRYFNGQIDEVRLWNTYLDQTLINKNNNIRLKGDELGLMFYYPFEKYFEFQNNKEMGFTLSDVKLQRDPKVIIPDAIAFNTTEDNDKAPIKDRGPVDNLQFNYVVNNDALIINMLEPKQAIDKTIVTFQVENVRDKNGNTIVSPVTWSAYIDQNQLKWSDEEINLTKDLYAPMEFESYVVNNGGSIENFRLENIPTWLKAEPSSGKVDPKGKQKITFTVNKGVNVGTYDEIVYMRNDNGEAESLALNLKVKGQAPDWKVNPADFKYSMSVLGKIRIDNIFSDDPEDIVAAFVDGKCVGVTNNSYTAQNDLWFAYLTVYGDSAQGGTVEFRIWDASTGKTYLGIPSEPITFTNDALFGTSRNPVLLDGKELLFQNIPLNKGWNWISFNLDNPALANVKSTLVNGNWQPGDLVKNEKLGFDQYSYGNDWVGYMKGFNNTNLFMLKTGTTQELSTSGALLDLKKTPITVQGGRWNYISYLPQVNITVTEALAGYEATDEDVIKSQTGFAIYDSRNGWVGNLTYMEPGKGYMLYRKGTTDTQFTYPVITGILGTGRLAGNNQKESARLNPYQLPVENNFKFADNMTVVAAAGREFTLLTGDKVLAYAGTELRGKSQPINNPVTGKQMMFFTISGTDNQPIHFEVERNGKMVAQTDPVMSYVSNGMAGDLRQPLLLHFGKASFETGIFPNPFREEVTIRTVLPEGTHEIQMSVYDVNGQVIVVHPKETTDGKFYQVKWNGRNSRGVACATGIYFIHVVADGRSHVYKVVKY